MGDLKREAMRLLPGLTLALLACCCHTAIADKPTGMVPPPLNSGPSMAAINSTYFRYDSVIAPTNYTWTDKPFITPVLSQFSCSSCWSLAATDAVSMMWAIANNLAAPVLGSAQQTCDCATKQCCQGGWPEWVFAYITFNGGLNGWSNYTYRANDYTTCPAALSSVSTIKATGWEYVPAFRSSLLMKAVYKQPVVVLIAADNDFFLYKGGVYDGNCTSNLNHAVVVVGYGQTVVNSQTVSYWTLKNSWGPTWGEGGYMRIAMYTGVGKCGMLSSPGVFPVYYPAGLQTVRFANVKNPVKPFDNDGWGNNNYNGRWWNLIFSFAVDACSGVINPCGAGSCYTLNGIARCYCPAGYVERLETPTSKCVTATPCTATFNPCSSGTCTNLNDGSYACSCPKGYAIGSRADGGTTCVSGGILGGYMTYVAVPGDTCTSVSLILFGSTSTATLTSLNPFLNCSNTYISPGAALVASTTVVGYSCSRNYIVQPGDWSYSVATAFGLSTTTLNNINYADTTYLMPGQSICVAAQTIASSDLPSQCSLTYNTTNNDSCSTVVTKNYKTGVLTSTTDLVSLNPGLNCSVTTLPYGVSICVSKSASSNSINCTQWYTVVHGDTCPSIWNAANLTLAAFLAINPGMQCQAPFLQVGTMVCIASPQASPFLDSATGNFPYTIINTDTFSSLYRDWSARCGGANTQSAICLLNGISPCTDASLNQKTGQVISIPCSQAVGDTCYCSPATDYCGGDFVSYPGYCDSNCNYATPGITMVNGCDTCRQICSNRPGLAPNYPSSYASYTSSCSTIWDGGSGSYSCKYPTWPPTNADWVVGNSSWGTIRQNCGFQNNICKDLCTQVMNKKQAQGSLTQNLDFMACYNHCYTDVPGGACNSYYNDTSSTPCKAYPGLCSCNCYDLTTCCTG